MEYEVAPFSDANRERHMSILSLAYTGTEIEYGKGYGAYWMNEAAAAAAAAAAAKAIPTVSMKLSKMRKSGAIGALSLLLATFSAAPVAASGL